MRVQRVSAISWGATPHFFCTHDFVYFLGTSNKVNRPWFRYFGKRLLTGALRDWLAERRSSHLRKATPLFANFFRTKNSPLLLFHTASSDVTSFMGNDSRDFSRFRRSRPEAGKRRRGGKKALRDTHTHSEKSDSPRRTYVDCFLENGEFSTIAIRPSFAEPPNLVHHFGDHCRRR